MLSDKDFGLLQSSVDAMMERLGSLRLNLIVERDFARLLKFLRAMNWPTQNPTFDPEVNDLRNAGFWLRIVDENGDTVASHAQRVFITADFHEVLGEIAAEPANDAPHIGFEGSAVETPFKKH